MRTFLKIIGAFIVVILIFLFWALDRVDYSPYFNSHYYSKTRSWLNSISSQFSLVKGEIHVGFGKVSITPGLGVEEMIGIQQ